MQSQVSSRDGNLMVDSWLAAIKQPAAIIDEDGVIVQLNTALQDSVGKSNSVVGPGSPLTSLLPDIAPHLPEKPVPFDTSSYLPCPLSGRAAHVRGLPLLLQDGSPGWCILLDAPYDQEEVEGQRLRLLLASLGDLVYVIGLDGIITECHQQLNHSQDLSPDDVVGKHYADYFPANVVDGLCEAIRMARQTDGTYRFDQAYFAEDETIWYSVNVKMLRDADGVPTGFLFASRNITERKRFEDSERDQRIYAEALQDVASALNSTLDLSAIWDKILVTLDRVAPADASAIVLVDGREARVVAMRGYSDHSCSERIRDCHRQVDSAEPWQQMLRTHQPVIASYASPLHAAADLDVDGTDGPHGELDTGKEWVRSYLGAPIVLDDVVIGFMRLESAVADRFTQQDATRLRAFCEHAATAIRNTRHFTQAKELAAFEERQRLARDLHDAVSQMLFSAKIIAEMLPRLRKRDPDSIWGYLLELQQLIQGAMGEMRMLLMELRPSILNDVELHVLLGYLVDANNARTSAKITVSAAEECSLPHNVQVAFYRIAQESLSNSVKYAHAKHISVTIEKRHDHVLMRISDDGAGFTQEEVRPENLGLGIMQERADEIGAQLNIVSNLENGTTVEVRWPAPKNAEISSADE